LYSFRLSKNCKHSEYGISIKLATPKVYSIDFVMKLVYIAISSRISVNISL
jgi:hypothetical protein